MAKNRYRKVYTVSSSCVPEVQYRYGQIVNRFSKENNFFDNSSQNVTILETSSLHHFLLFFSYIKLKKKIMCQYCTAFI